PIQTWGDRPAWPPPAESSLTPISAGAYVETPVSNSCGDSTSRNSTVSGVPSSMRTPRFVAGRSSSTGSPGTPADGARVVGAGCSEYGGGGMVSSGSTISDRKRTRLNPSHEKDGYA